MNDTYQMSKEVLQLDNQGSIVDSHWENVGPEFMAQEKIWDYAKAVIPQGDWWNIKVNHFFGEFDPYGVPDELVTTDLEEWMDNFEKASIDPAYEGANNAQIQNEISKKN